MVSLTCSAEARNGVTLVTARLDGGGVAQRVRLVNRLDGPVWPPKRDGVPEAGWDGERFETLVPAETTVAVGYASPAPPTDSPLAIVDRATVAGETHEESVTPASALRDLGDPLPPRDAVPIPLDEPTESSDCVDSQLDPCSGVGPPDAVRWLDAVEERIEMAERLTAAETLPEATDALCQIGSLDDAETLVEDLREDARSLDALARRAEELSERAMETDVPLTTLDRLA